MKAEVHEDMWFVLRVPAEKCIKVVRQKKSISWGQRYFAPRIPMTISPGNWGTVACLFAENRLLRRFLVPGSPQDSDPVGLTGKLSC